MSNYICVVTCLFFNVFNEIFNDTDYSVSRLCIILKLFIITGSVSCTVLDILRSHSITKTLSLNKLVLPKHQYSL